MHAAVGLSCSSVCFFVLHSCQPLSARLASHFLRAGSAFPFLLGRGLRSETEFIGFAGMRTQTGSRWTWRKRLN